MWGAGGCWIAHSNPSPPPAPAASSSIPFPTFSPLPSSATPTKSLSDADVQRSYLSLPFFCFPYMTLSSGVATLLRIQPAVVRQNFATKSALHAFTVVDLKAILRLLLPCT